MCARTKMWVCSKLDPGCKRKKKPHTHKVRKIQNNALGLREAIKGGFLNAARIL